MTAGKTTFTPSDKLFIGAIFTVAALVGLVWAGAAAAAFLTGNPVPRHRLGVHLARLLRDAGNPSAAWGQPMPSAGWYWTITIAVALLAAALVTAGALGWRRVTRDGPVAPRHVPGLAGGREISKLAGRGALLRRAPAVRPSVTDPTPQQVGYRLGRAGGRTVWMSAEDSLLVVGPPRSGKGLHLVIPAILEAPGAVITTSTRPDNLTTTLRARRAGDRPVAVFDPQGLAPGAPSRLRWSPIRGCQNPQTAMIRARALAAGTSRGTEDADFWQSATESVLRCLLHAAALDARPAAELRRWSLSPALAAEAVRILNTTSGAAPGWGDELDAILAADPRTRDSVWAGVRVALAALADPRVLDAVTPQDAEGFDPATFLRESGTLYLLGTSAGAGAAGNLIAAWVEDIVDIARRQAARKPGGRLDPPAALILDEAANYPLPSLPSLMSEGGGSGLTTVAVLQSIAQGRAVWGEHAAAALCDAATNKLILGGGSNTRDLADLAALIGDRDEPITTDTRDPAGRRSTSSTLRRVPILDAAELRTLPFGTAVALLRTAPPAQLHLTPWTARPEAALLAANRVELEQAARTAGR